MAGALPDSDQAFFLLKNGHRVRFDRSYNPDELVGIGDWKYSVPNVPRACLPRDRVADHVRLVEASKSPTSASASDFSAGVSVEYCESVRENWLFDPASGEIRSRAVAVPAPDKAAGLYAVTEWRAWSDEYRIRTEARLHVEPPSPSTGDRLTWLLTDRGARKIADACHYVALKYGGFNTFLTLTFSPEKRDAVARGETSFQRETSRCMDGLQKIYQRDGWAARMGCDTLLYCWVVEIPKNDKGEDNPHVHVLMRWSVKRAEFDMWAKRIESLWGQGWANLQKIDDPKAAGAYMAKAAGYLTKANDQPDQGMVRGNRYGISKAARAPLWAVIDEQELGAMGLIIAELHDFMQHKYGDLYRNRAMLNRERNATPKSQTWRRNKLAEKLAGVRKQIAKIPVVASKYLVTMKGRAAFEAFKEWASGDRIPAFELPQPEWLPEALPAFVQPDTARPDSQWYRRIKTSMENRKHQRDAWTDAMLEALVRHREKCKADMLRYWNDQPESKHYGENLWLR